MSSHIFATRKLDSTQQLRLQKMEEVLAEVRKSACAGVPVEIGETSFITTFNFLSGALFSMDLIKPGSEEGGKELRVVVGHLMDEIGKPNLSDYFPMLKRIDPTGRKRQSAVYFKQLLDMIDDLINKRLQQRENSADPSGDTDILDSLLDICEDKSEEIISMDHIKFLLLVPFAAFSCSHCTYSFS